ncbi:MAG: arginine N-succinyltransferase [Legionellales bacterium]|nr:arginine N-succinyltransferase [Legionellales bacterium]
MLIIRLATENDIPAVAHFAELLHGKLNSLPMDKRVIAHKIQRSCISVEQDIISPYNELYFFVMEDTEKQSIVGCAAIDACVGLKPFYAFRIAQFEHISHEQNFRRKVKLLELNTELDGSTELCSLYLLPEYRKKNNGKLLSLSRLMFMAIFPKRFSDRVFADIRGYSEEDEDPPFWKHVIKPFMPFDFMEAETLTGLEKRQFIIDLMPKFPICVNLLPPSAQAAIGRSHPTTASAKTMLERQGFHFHDYVSIFDAGPTVMSFINNIHIMNERRFVMVTGVNIPPAHTHTLLSQKKYLLATTTNSFRVALEEAQIEDDEVIISSESAKNLGVDVGDTLCVFNI